MINDIPVRTIVMPSNAKGVRSSRRQTWPCFNIFIFFLTGYHQKCHNPGIEDKALEPEEPWMCVYCSDETECPYLLNPFETNLKNLTSMSARKTREDSKVILIFLIKNSRPKVQTNVAIISRVELALRLS